ncbi:hypothetical protein HK102_005369 [Quaeritorhiza haematococci]|nr:hypothetical protein HK102_005369 [Quaeritorhiza haematococci]
MNILRSISRRHSDKSPLLPTTVQNAASVQLYVNTTTNGSHDVTTLGTPTPATALSSPLASSSITIPRRASDGGSAVPVDASTTMAVGGLSGTGNPPAETAEKDNAKGKNVNTNIINALSKELKRLMANNITSKLKASTEIAHLAYTGGVAMETAIVNNQRILEVLIGMAQNPHEPFPTRLKNKSKPSKR